MEVKNQDDKEEKVKNEKKATEKKDENTEDEEERIEVTKETYDPKEFEDEDEVRDDWMQPETKSSNEFIDQYEHADMPEITASSAQEENEQFDWIKDEFENSKDARDSKDLENEDSFEENKGMRRSIYI